LAFPYQKLSKSDKSEKGQTKSELWNVGVEFQFKQNEYGICVANVSTWGFQLNLSSRVMPNYVTVHWL